MDEHGEEQSGIEHVCECTLCRLVREWWEALPKPLEAEYEEVEE